MSTMSQYTVESKELDHKTDVGKSVEAAVRKSNREISESGRELAQYVRDLYDSGAKLWTTDMFRDIEVELAKEPMPHAVMIRSMNGLLRRKQIPLEGLDPLITDMGHLYVFMYFKIYQQMVFDAEEETFELDPDEDVLLDIDTDDNMALATRALTLLRTNKTSSSIEYVQLKAAWDEAWYNWTQSAVCRELTAILESGACIPQATRKIVCFGLGSLEGSSDHSSLDILATCDGLPQRSSMTQHAAAITIASVLSKRLGTYPLPILAQDPDYSMVAKQLLKDCGIEVVGGRGSLAFTHVDEDTIVFSCNPNIPVKQVVADIARPAAMIWNRVAPATEENSQWVVEVINGEEVLFSPWSTDQDSPRTLKLVEDYDRCDFPAERERFGNLEIYIRRDKECLSF